MTEAEDIPLDPSTLIRIGTISALDLAGARCMVRYGDPDDEDGAAETPWIRWLCHRSGQTGTWSPPSIGEQVLLLCPDGQIGAGLAIGGIVQDLHPPVGDDNSHGIAFADGARIFYDPAAHALTALLPGSATARIEAPGGITLVGPITIEGDVAIQGKLDATGEVASGDVKLTTHKHLTVQPGSGQSGPPAP